MKKLFVLILFACSLAYSQQTPCNQSGPYVNCSTSVVPLLVQGTNATSTGSVANIQPAFATNNAAGNSIIVSCGVGNNVTATVTDSQSNVYALAVNEPSGTAFSSQIFIAVNIKAGANTVTIAPSSSVSLACRIMEWTGLLTATNVAGGSALAAALPIDSTSVNTLTGTAVTSGPAGTLVPNEIAIVAVAVGTGTSTFGAVTPAFATDYSVNTAGTPAGVFSFLSASAYLPVSESVNAAVTLGTSRPWTAAIATFRPVVAPVAFNSPTTSPSVGIAVSTGTPANTAVTTAVAIKTTPGNLYGWALGNANTINCYLQFFNTSSVTLGTTPEILDVFVPAGGGNNYSLPFPISFSVAIYVASTTTQHGPTTTGCGQEVAIFYQ